MIHNSRQEPSIRPVDESAIADFAPQGNFKADAKRGSQRLLRAILKARQPKRRPLSRARKSYGTWEERKARFSEIQEVQRVVADHFGLSVDVMTGRRGPNELAEKRQLAMLLSREVVRSSYPDIGKCFGGKDHTTVMHACRVVERNPDLLTAVTKLRERLST